MINNTIRLLFATITFRWYTGLLCDGLKHTLIQETDITQTDNIIPNED